jgi:hypothetical protein
MASTPVPEEVRSVLTALARGALGEGYVPEVPDRMLEALDHLPSPADRAKLFNALKWMNSRAGALALTGRAVPVSWLSPGEAEAVLLRWKNSRLAAQRQLFLLLVSKALAAIYGHPGPEWDRIGYQGPIGPPPDAPKELDVLRIERDEVISCDVVIVGSGPGGGTAAAILSQAGYDVCVIEKGGYYNEADFNHLEADAAKMYLNHMNLATTDLGVQIIAGSVLGGGSLVNYSTSFKTPPHVLEEWARVSGIGTFVSGEMDDALEVAASRNNVNADTSAAGKRDEILEEGLKKLGWHVDAMPRGVRGCTQDEQCGYCGFGCRPGGKQSTMRTWLLDAHRNGARIIVEADVRRVRISNGRAIGIEAYTAGRRLTVNSRAVVVSAGAIESPALLLRSGLGGAVGRYLRLHPSTAAWGKFDDDVRMWEGTLQARYSAEFRDWDNGYGPIFETVPVHPGTGAAAVPWLSAADHRERMGDYAKIGFCAPLLRDEAHGRVVVTKDGSPKVTYRLSPADHRRTVEGVIRAAQVIEAAGAREVYTLHRDPIVYDTAAAGSHERWAESVRERGFSKGQTTLFSFHQMGSCRMGIDPKSSVVDANNESHEVRDLFVVDGSNFPTASGVNPMLSIYGIAVVASNRIAKRLS